MFVIRNFEGQFVTGAQSNHQRYTGSLQHARVWEMATEAAANCRVDEKVFTVHEVLTNLVPAARAANPVPPKTGKKGKTPQPVPVAESVRVVIELTLACGATLETEEVVNEGWSDAATREAAICVFHNRLAALRESMLLDDESDDDEVYLDLRYEGQVRGRVLVDEIVATWATDIEDPTNDSRGD